MPKISTNVPTPADPTIHTKADQFKIAITAAARSKAFRNQTTIFPATSRVQQLSQAITTLRWQAQAKQGRRCYKLQCSLGISHTSDTTDRIGLQIRHK
jgi:hypothetical protein